MQRDRLAKQWDGFPLDSDEEYLFMCWYEEAMSLGLVGNLVVQPSFILTPRQSITVKCPTKKNPDKTKDKFLFHPHNYKADFSFEVVVESDSAGNTVPKINRLCGPKGKPLIHQYVGDRHICVVDIKGGWANHRSRNSSDVTFPINQKLVYNKYNIYVNKAVINNKKGLFKDFWAPDEAFITPKGNPSKVYRTCARLANVKKEVDTWK